MTCWEIFTCGKIPYPGVDSSELPKSLERGRRLEKPDNAACSDTMLAKKCAHYLLESKAMPFQVLTDVEVLGF